VKFIVLVVHNSKPSKSFDVDAITKEQLLAKARKATPSGYSIESILDNRTTAAVWTNGSWTRYAQEVILPD
jgi:hypothetical protein